MIDFLLVSLGTLLGSNIRFITYEKLVSKKITKEYSILIINTSASFLLGFFFSFLTRISSLNLSDKLVLLFLIGFLGSLSTFSTFIYDTFELFLKIRFFRALNLFFISSALGVISLAFGFVLGRQ